MIRGIWGIFVLLVLTPLFAVPGAIGALLFRNGNFCVRMGRLWSRGTLAALGIRPRYHGLENAFSSLPCVYISNHMSVVDIWVLLAVLPDSVRFVAKREVFRVPFAGWAIGAAGFIPIDRSNRAAAIRSLARAAETIRGGDSVLLFAEGTRSRDGSLQPFKKGAFHLALEAGVPVVPITIRGTFSVIPPRSIRVEPGPVDVRFSSPLDVAPYRPSDVAGLLAAVREKIAAPVGPPAGATEDPAPSCASIS